MSRFTRRICRLLAAVLGVAFAGHAAAQIQVPNVGFSFGSSVPPDTDPAPYIVDKATGPLTFGTAASYSIREGHGRASVPDGRLSLSFREDYYGPAFNVATSTTGNATTAVFYDALVAGASGTITLTLTGHAAVAASQVVLPLQTDNSWAGFGFQLIAQVFNPGAGGYVGGGGEARSIIDDATNRAAPSTTVVSAGTAGVRKAITSSLTLNGREGGTMTLTAWVGAGDRLRFSTLAAARGWADTVPGGFSFADLLNTGQMSVSGSPGMTWSSESGVFLSAVPEPAPAALWAAGLLVLVALKRSGSRTGTPARAASRA